MSPEVSVVIPTRNRRDLLTRAVASVLSQQDVRVQILVVDDGSTDGTAEMVRSWGLSSVALWRCPESVGVSQARNIGISCADAPWVAFLDDDDVWAPMKLKTQLAALAAAPQSRWCCTGAVWIDEAGHLTGFSAPTGAVVTHHDVMAHNTVPGGGSSVLAETALLREQGGFAPDLALFEDWELWIRVARSGDGVAIDRPLVGFRIGKSTTTRNVDGLRLAWGVVAARHAESAINVGVTPDFSALLRFEAFRYLQSGQYRQAAERYRELGKGSAAAAVRALGPGWRRLQTYRNTRAIPASWRAEADAWVPIAVRDKVPEGSSCQASLAPPA